MASSGETVKAAEKAIVESESSQVVHSAAASSSDADLKEVEASGSKEAVPASSQDATSTAIADQKPKTVEVKIESVPAASMSGAGDVKDVKETETSTSKEAPENSLDASSTKAATIVQAQKTEEVKVESVSAPSTSGSRDVKDVKKATQEAPSTTPALVIQAQKTGEVKVESVSTVIAGVVSDINNVQVGVAKEAPPDPGNDPSAPSLIDTLEGGLQIVEKEVVKGAIETVQAVEQHPELIAEGALAAVVGAASLVQPEVLPGAIAIVGKMAMDNAKKTATKIVTDEGKKVANAIGKDISDDAAKEKAASDPAKASTDPTKDEKPAGKNASDLKPDPVDASKNAMKAPVSSDGKPAAGVEAKSDASGDHTVAIEVAQEQGKTGSTSEEAKAQPDPQPVSLKITIGKDGEVKAVTQTVSQPEAADGPPAKEPLKKPEEPAIISTDPKTAPEPASVKVEKSAKEKTEAEVKPPAVIAAPPLHEVKPTEKGGVPQSSSEAPNGVVNGSSPKAVPMAEEQKEAPASAPEQPSTSQQEPQASLIVAVASVTQTTTTTKTTNEEPVANLEQQMVMISKENLDLLHQKIDAMHEAIKQITETLALHLPRPTPAIEASKQTAAEVAPSEGLSEPELISAPTEASAAPESPPADITEAPVEPVTPASEQSPPKRPSLEKRSSVLGSVGKIFWPFGSSSSTKTAVDQTGNSTTNLDTPKVPTVTVSEVPLTPEIEI